MKHPHELSVTRFIAAPTEKVWDVMVNRTNEWWCPKPWRAEVDFGARKPGTTTHTTMYGPDGEVNHNPGFTLAWDEGKRFASTDAIEGDLMPGGPFMLGVWSIEPEESEGISGTRYTAVARHWTAETCAHHKEMGFTEGWGICADQLKALCEET